MKPERSMGDRGNEVGHTCRYVVGYEREVPGSDVADPRIRCGRPATVRLEDGTWLCAPHAEEVRPEREG